MTGGSGAKPSPRKELVVFAAAAVVGETVYTIEGVSAILVAVGTGLSFAMLPATVDPSLYFDISIRNIQSIEHSDSQSEPRSQVTMSQSPRQFCLNIRLAPCEEGNYYLNAKASHADGVMLVYDHPKDAELVADALSNLWFKVHGKTLEVEASKQLLSVQNEPEPLDLTQGAEQPSKIETDGDRDGDVFQMVSDTVTIGQSTAGDVPVASEIRYASQGASALQDLQAVEEETSETDSNQSVDSRDSRENNSIFDVDGQKGRATGERAGDDSALFRSIDNPGTAVSTNHQAKPLSRPQGLILNNNVAGTHRAKVIPATARLLDPGVQSNMQTDQRSSQRIPANNLYDATPSPQTRDSGLLEESDTLANKSAVMGPVRPGDNVLKIKKMSYQMRDHSGYTSPQLEEAKGNPMTTKPPKDRDLISSSIHKAQSAALNKSSSCGIEQTLGDTDQVPKSTKPSLQQPQRDAKAVNAPTSQNANPPKLLDQSIKTSKSGRSTVPEREVAASNSYGAPTQTSSSVKLNGKFSAPQTTLNNSLRNVPDASVNWDEAYEAQNDKDSPAKGKAAKPTRRRKPAANQKKSRVHPSTPRSSKAKESIFPLGNQKARRTAAVKANKAIQGIAEDESSESTEHSSNDPPVARPLTKVSAITSENRNPPIATAPMVPVKKAPTKADISPTGTPDLLSHANTTPHNEFLTNAKTTQPSGALMTRKYLAPAMPRVHSPLKVLKSPTPQRSTVSAAAESLLNQTSSAAEDPGLNPEKNLGENVHAGIPALIGLRHTTAATDVKQRANEETKEQVDTCLTIKDATSDVPVVTTSHVAPSNHNGGDHVPEPIFVMEERPEPLESFTFKELSCHSPDIAQESPYGKISTSKNSSKIVEPVSQATTARFPSESQTRAESHDNHTEAEIEQPFFADAMEFADEPDTAVSSDPPQVPEQTHDVQWRLQNDKNTLGNVQSNHSKATEKTIDKAALGSKPLTATKLQSALSVIPQLRPIQSSETINSITKGHSSQRKPKRYGEKRKNEVEEPSTFHTEHLDSRTSQKRRRDQADEGRLKKRRDIKGKQTEVAHEGQLNGQQSTSRAPNVYQKPNVVHFESAGPANQGSSAGKKRKASSVGDVEDASDLQPIIDEGIEGGHNQGRTTLNRKVLTPPQKRPKVEFVKPYGLTTTTRFPQPTKSLKSRLTEPFRVASSQSSRVDEFGSPRLLQADSSAFISLPKALHRPTNKLPDLEESLEPDNEFSVESDDLDPVEARRITQNQRKCPPIVESSTAVSVNSKHRPSSPLAPSSIVADLTAHEEQPNGRLIDIHTARVIEPRKPQDPFLETVRERPSAFLDKLKKASEIRTGKGQTHGREPDISAQNLLQNEDPEKTLIGDIASQDERVSNTPSAPSSSSKSSSSADDESVSDGDDDGFLAWRKAIDSHERDIAKALDRISAVSDFIVKYFNTNGYAAYHKRFRRQKNKASRPCRGVPTGSRVGRGRIYQVTNERVHRL